MSLCARAFHSVCVPLCEEMSYVWHAKEYFQETVNGFPHLKTENFTLFRAWVLKGKLSSFYSRYAQPKYAREHAAWLITETGYGSIWAEVVLRREFFGKWDFQTKPERYLSTITVKRWRFSENTHARRCWARFEWNWYLYCGTEKTLQRNRVLCALDWFEAFEQFCRFLQIDFSFLLSIDSL